MSETPFGLLRRTEQLRELRRIVRGALNQYGVADVRIALLHHRTNAIYRITRCSDGARFVLRIHSTQSARAQICSELMWLDALHADGLAVPRPIATPGHERVVTVNARNCSLLTWTHGRIAGKRLSPKLLRRIGQQIASLHHHAAQFSIPAGFMRPRRDVEALNNDRARCGWTRFNVRQASVLGEVAERFQTAANRLGSGHDVFGVIHGDFTFDNLLVDRDKIRVIDFDDCGFGYYLYDIATLLDRMEWRDDYDSLRTALLEGYRECRDLSGAQEELLDLFILVRWLFLALAFVSAPENSPGRLYSARFLDIVVPKIRKYLPRLPI